MEKRLRGLRLDIFKSNGQSFSNGGVSSKVNSVTLVGPGVPEISLASDESPAVVFQDGPYDTMRVVPLDLVEQKKWTMFGGTFVYTSDSRFTEAVRKFFEVEDASVALKLFDRVEG